MYTESGLDMSNVMHIPFCHRLIFINICELYYERQELVDEKYMLYKRACAPCVAVVQVTAGLRSVERIFNEHYFACII